VKQSKKQEIIQSLKKEFSENSTAVAIDYRGLNMIELSDLRGRLREQKCTLRVVKNTLSVIASEGTPYKDYTRTFAGPTAMVLTKENPVPLAKVLMEYAKQNDKVKLKSGFLQGKIISPEEIKEVAKLPSREILIGRFIGLIQAPISNLLSVLQGPSRSLVTALKAVADSKQEKDASK
jgi:large subunit ribosomal protein L10